MAPDSSAQGLFEQCQAASPSGSADEEARLHGQAADPAERADPLHAEIRSLKADEIASQQKDKESEERAMWQDKYTAHLRATPRAGIEEAEYRSAAKLEVLSKQHSNATQRTSKLEAE